MVKNQARTILLAVPQLTARLARVAPTPMIEPEIAWVVETGKPIKLEAASTMALPVSAAKPW